MSSLSPSWSLFFVLRAYGRTRCILVSGRYYILVTNKKTPLAEYKQEITPHYRHPHPRLGRQDQSRVRHP